MDAQKELPGLCWEFQVKERGDSRAPALQAGRTLWALLQCCSQPVKHTAGNSWAAAPHRAQGAAVFSSPLINLCLQSLQFLHPGKVLFPWCFKVSWCIYVTPAQSCCLMEREQTMSSLQPAAKEPLQSTGTHPLPPAHPNTSGNAHGQSDSTLRAGEEKQVMRQ